MHVVIQNQSAEDREIIKWALPLNFFPRQEDILRARQPGTGEWLLQDGMFKRWKAGEINALWCRGVREFHFPTSILDYNLNTAGAGKTVLVCVIS